jgi:hypothetical protein
VAGQRAAGRMRLTIRFDEPVDVVTCDKFSAFCQRVSCNLNEKYGSSTRQVETERFCEP